MQTRKETTQSVHFYYVLSLSIQVFFLQSLYIAHYESSDSDSELSRVVCHICSTPSSIWIQKILEEKSWKEKISSFSAFQTFFRSNFFPRPFLFSKPPQFKPLLNYYCGHFKNVYPDNTNYGVDSSLTPRIVVLMPKIHLRHHKYVVKGKFFKGCLLKFTFDNTFGCMVGVWSVWKGHGRC